MKNLYHFYVDCGRLGFLEGLFVATPEQINNIITKYVPFDEVLGKHSYIEILIGKDNLKIISDDSEFVNSFEKLVGSVGHNPLDYYEDEDEF